MKWELFSFFCLIPMIRIKSDSNRDFAKRVARIDSRLEIRFVIEGIKTTIPFHIKLMEDERFRSGKFNTAFLETFDFSKL